MVYIDSIISPHYFSSEVDLNGSLWYTVIPFDNMVNSVLKLTSTGHYGISADAVFPGDVAF